MNYSCRWINQIASAVGYWVVSKVQQQFFSVTSCLYVTCNVVRQGFRFVSIEFLLYLLHGDLGWMLLSGFFLVTNVLTEYHFGQQRLLNGLNVNVHIIKRKSRIMLDNKGLFLNKELSLPNCIITCEPIKMLLWILHCISANRSSPDCFRSPVCMLFNSISIIRSWPHNAIYSLYYI